MMRIAGLSSDLWEKNEKSPVESIGLEESNGGVPRLQACDCYRRTTILLDLRSSYIS